MKIAFCLFGGTGQKVKRQSQVSGNLDNSLIDPSICYNHYKHFGFLGDNVDVFFHTWDTPFEDLLVELYQPKKYSIEPTQDFGVRLPDRTIPPKKEQEYGTKSRFYSTNQVTELWSQYAKENDVQYDFVFLTRFDILFSVAMDYEKYDNKYFYLQHSPYLEKKEWNIWHAADWWFMGNPKDLYHFGTMYEDIDSLLVPPIIMPSEFKSEDFQRFRSAQHGVVRSRINQGGYECRYIFNRDLDHNLVRQCLSGKNTKQQDIWDLRDDIYYIKPNLHYSTEIHTKEYE